MVDAADWCRRQCDKGYTNDRPRRRQQLAEAKLHRGRKGIRHRHIHGTDRDMTRRWVILLWLLLQPVIALRTFVATPPA
jgi:hypothetical protein